MYGSKFPRDKYRPAEQAGNGVKRLLSLAEINDFGRKLPLLTKETTNGKFNVRGGLLSKRNIAIACGLAGVGLGVALVAHKYNCKSRVENKIKI